MKPQQTVAGIHAAPAKPTWGALGLFMRWIGLPLIGGLFLTDLILWSFGIWPYAG